MRKNNEKAHIDAENSAKTANPKNVAEKIDYLARLSKEANKRFELSKKECDSFLRLINKHLLGYSYEIIQDAIIRVLDVNKCYVQHIKKPLEAELFLSDVHTVRVIYNKIVEVLKYDLMIASFENLTSLDSMIEGYENYLK